jgi:hypothetical protein
MFKWSMTIDYFVRFYVSLPQNPPPKVPSLAWNVDVVVESLEGVVHNWGVFMWCHTHVVALHWHCGDLFVKKPFGRCSKMRSTRVQI